jgi:hypothetical protein
MTHPHPDQGLSLADIARAYEDVDIGAAARLRVYGISAKGLFSIFQQFPEVGQWFKGGKFDPKALIAQVPECIAGVIAAGCGYAGNAEMVQKAEDFAVEAQIDIMEAIFRLTFKNGFGPFVQRMVALSAQAESQNYGRGLATTLPQGSQTVSQPDTTPTPSGI